MARHWGSMDGSEKAGPQTYSSSTMAGQTANVGGRVDRWLSNENGGKRGGVDRWLSNENENGGWRIQGRWDRWCRLRIADGGSRGGGIVGV